MHVRDSSILSIVAPSVFSFAAAPLRETWGAAAETESLWEDPHTSAGQRDTDVEVSSGGVYTVEQVWNMLKPDTIPKISLF